MALHIITVEDDDHAGNSVLLKKAQTVMLPLSKDDKTLIELMKAKLYELDGVGLAAPQVGYSKSIIAIYIPENATLLRDNAIPYPMHILINPNYEAINSHDKSADFEACYSIRSKAGKVLRYNTIRLNYQDEQGNTHQRIETGFYARVLQHEIDHLQGVLITKRLTPNCIQGTLEKMYALRRKELAPDKKLLFDELISRKHHNKDSLK